MCVLSNSLLLLSFFFFFCFTRMCMQCDCSIRMIVATSRSCINMPSERDVPHDFRIAHTQQPQQLNSIMPRSSEERRRQPVASWKTISVRRLTCVRSRPMEGSGGQLCSQFSLLRDAINPSLLPPSVHFINFCLNISGLKCIHGPLHTRYSMGFIKNEWGRPLKPFTETLERDWRYFYPVLRLGMENSDNLRKRVWTGSVVFTFVTHGLQNVGCCFILS